jgi:hypothetical protein
MCQLCYFYSWRICFLNINQQLTATEVANSVEFYKIIAQSYEVK